jgi:hypothetical protein
MKQNYTRDTISSNEPNKLSKYLENLDKKKYSYFNIASQMKTALDENQIDDFGQNENINPFSKYPTQIPHIDQNIYENSNYYHPTQNSHFYYPRLFNDFGSEKMYPQNEEEQFTQKSTNSKRKDSSGVNWSSETFNQQRKYESSQNIRENYYDYAKEKYISYSNQEEPSFVYSLDDSPYNRHNPKNNYADHRLPSHSHYDSNVFPSPFMVLQPIDKHDRVGPNGKFKNKMHKIIEAVMGAIQD